MMVQFSKCAYGPYYLSLFSYCKSKAFTLNTLIVFCKIHAQPKHIFRFSRGGGGQLKYNFQFLLSLCNQISTSTFRFAVCTFGAPSIWKCFLRPCDRRQPNTGQTNNDARIITLELNPSRGTVLPAPCGKGNKCEFTRTSKFFKLR